MKTISSVNPLAEDAALIHDQYVTIGREGAKVRPGYRKALQHLWFRPGQRGVNPKAMIKNAIDLAEYELAAEEQRGGRKYSIEAVAAAKRRLEACKANMAAYVAWERDLVRGAA